MPYPAVLLGACYLSEPLKAMNRRLMVTKSRRDLAQRRAPLTGYLLPANFFASVFSGNPPGKLLAVSEAFMKASKKWRCFLC